MQFVDFDSDGRLDLALTNNDPDGGGHPLLRNTAVSRGRGFLIDVVDARGRRTLAGSEIRVFEPGTRRLLAATLVDGGSGYCSQNAMPAHVGIPSVWIKNVDVEVVAIVGGQRRIVSVQLVKFEEHKRTPLRIQAT